MAYKRLQIIEKQPGVPIEHSVVTRRLGTPTIFTPEIVFDVSNLYPVFVRNSSLGTDFVWTGGLLDVSIVTMDYAYVNASLAQYATNASVNLAFGAYATNVSVGLALTKYVPNTGGAFNGDVSITGANIITGLNGNVRLGEYSLPFDAGASNVAVGGSALTYFEDGNNNVAIGYSAAIDCVHPNGNFTGASNSIYIGAYTRPSISGVNNEIVIGAAASGRGSNTVAIGSVQAGATYLHGALYVNNLLWERGYSRKYIDGSINAVYASMSGFASNASVNTLRNDVSTAYLKINDASASYIKNLASIRSSSTNYTVALSDLNNFIEASGNLTVTFPNNLPAGFQTVVYNVGDGVITLNASTLYTTDSSIYIRQKYAAASALHKGSGVWFAFGNIQ